MSNWAESKLSNGWLEQTTQLKCLSIAFFTLCAVCLATHWFCLFHSQGKDWKSISVCGYHVLSVPTRYLTRSFMMSLFEDRYELCLYICNAYVLNIHIQAHKCIYIHISIYTCMCWERLSCYVLLVAHSKYRSGHSNTGRPDSQETNITTLPCWFSGGFRRGQAPKRKLWPSRFTQTGFYCDKTRGIVGGILHSDILHGIHTTKGQFCKKRPALCNLLLWVFWRRPTQFSTVV